MGSLGPLPDAPFTVKIRLLGAVGGGKWANVLHAQYAGGTIDTAALNTLATAVRTAWVTNFASLVPSVVTLQTVECTDISTRTGAQGTDTTGGTGTRVGTVLPASVACCVSWKVGVRYRGGHPRSYFPGPVTADVTGSTTWAAAYVTAMSTAAAAFRTAINASTAGGATWAMSAVSYFHKVGGVEAYKTPPDRWLVTGSQVHTRVDTMRRRLGRELS
jgi:hypothetical protein